MSMSSCFVSTMALVIFIFAPAAVHVQSAQFPREAFGSFRPIWLRMNFASKGPSASRKKKEKKKERMATQEESGRARVEIVVEDQSFVVDRRLLAMCSPFFRRTLEDEGNKNLRKLKLSGVSAATFSTLLDYMLTGKLNVTRENVSDVFNAAFRLNMPDVVNKCIELQSEATPLGQQVLMYTAARRMNRADEEQRAYDFLTANFISVANTKEFLELDAQDVIHLMSAQTIGCHSEVEVFEAGMRWVNHNSEERDKLATNIMASVRFNHMNLSDLHHCLEYPGVPHVVRQQIIHVIRTWLNTESGTIDTETESKTSRRFTPLNNQSSVSLTADFEGVHSASSNAQPQSADVGSTYTSDRFVLSKPLLRRGNQDRHNRDVLVSSINFGASQGDKDTLSKTGSYMDTFPSRGIYDDSSFRRNPSSEVQGASSIIYSENSSGSVVEEETHHRRVVQTTTEEVRTIRRIRRSRLDTEPQTLVEETLWFRRGGDDMIKPPKPVNINIRESESIRVSPTSTEPEKMIQRYENIVRGVEMQTPLVERNERILSASFASSLFSVGEFPHADHISMISPASSLPGDTASLSSVLTAKPSIISIGETRKISEEEELYSHHKIYTSSVSVYGAPQGARSMAESGLEQQDKTKVPSSESEKSFLPAFWLETTDLSAYKTGSSEIKSFPNIKLDEVEVPPGGATKKYTLASETSEFSTDVCPAPHRLPVTRETEATEGTFETALAASTETERSKTTEDWAVQEWVPSPPPEEIHSSLIEEVVTPSPPREDRRIAATEDIVSSPPESVQSAVIKGAVPSPPPEEVRSAAMEEVIPYPPPEHEKSAAIEERVPSPPPEVIQSVAMKEVVPSPPPESVQGAAIEEIIPHPPPEHEKSTAIEEMVPSPPPEVVQSVAMEEVVPSPPPEGIQSAAIEEMMPSPPPEVVQSVAMHEVVPSPPPESFQSVAIEKVVPPLPSEVKSATTEELVPCPPPEDLQIAVIEEEEVVPCPPPEDLQIAVVEEEVVPCPPPEDLQIAVIEDEVVPCPPPEDEQISAIEEEVVQSPPPEDLQVAAIEEIVPSPPEEVVPSPPPENLQIAVIEEVVPSPPPEVLQITAIENVVPSPPPQDIQSGAVEELVPSPPPETVQSATVEEVIPSPVPEDVKSAAIEEVVPSAPHKDLQVAAIEDMVPSPPLEYVQSTVIQKGAESPLPEVPSPALGASVKSAPDTDIQNTAVQEWVASPPPEEIPNTAIQGWAESLPPMEMPSSAIQEWSESPPPTEVPSSTIEAIVKTPPDEDVQSTAVEEWVASPPPEEISSPAVETPVTPPTGDLQSTAMQEWTESPPPDEIRSPPIKAPVKFPPDAGIQSTAIQEWVASPPPEEIPVPAVEAPVKTPPTEDLQSTAVLEWTESPLPEEIQSSVVEAPVTSLLGTDIQGTVIQEWVASPPPAEIPSPAVRAPAKTPPTEELEHAILEWKEPPLPEEIPSSADESSVKKSTTEDIQSTAIQEWVASPPPEEITSPAVEASVKPPQTEDLQNTAILEWTESPPLQEIPSSVIQEWTASQPSEEIPSSAGEASHPSEYLKSTSTQGWPASPPPFISVGEISSGVSRTYESALDGLVEEFRTINEALVQAGSMDTMVAEAMMPRKGERITSVYSSDAEMPSGTSMVHTLSSPLAAGTEDEWILPQELPVEWSPLVVFPDVLEMAARVTSATEGTKGIVEVTSSRELAGEWSQIAAKPDERISVRKKEAPFAPSAEEDAVLSSKLPDERVTLGAFPDDRTQPHEVSEIKGTGTTEPEYPSKEPPSFQQIHDVPRRGKYILQKTKITATTATHSVELVEENVTPASLQTSEEADRHACRHAESANICACHNALGKESDRKTPHPCQESPGVCRADKLNHGKFAEKGGVSIPPSLLRTRIFAGGLSHSVELVSEKSIVTQDDLEALRCGPFMPSLLISEPHNEDIYLTSIEKRCAHGHTDADRPEGNLDNDEILTLDGTSKEEVPRAIEVIMRKISHVALQKRQLEDEYRKEVCEKRLKNIEQNLEKLTKREDSLYRALKMLANSMSSPTFPTRSEEVFSTTNRDDTQKESESFFGHISSSVFKTKMDALSTPVTTLLPGTIYEGTVSSSHDTMHTKICVETHSPNGLPDDKSTLSSSVAVVVETTVTKTPSGDTERSHNSRIPAHNERGTIENPTLDESLKIPPKDRKSVSEPSLSSSRPTTEQPVEASRNEADRTRASGQQAETFRLMFNTAQPSQQSTSNTNVADTIFISDTATASHVKPTAPPQATRSMGAATALPPKQDSSQQLLKVVRRTIVQETVTTTTIEKKVSTKTVLNERTGVQEVDSHVEITTKEEVHDNRQEDIVESYDSQILHSSPSGVTGDGAIDKGIKSTMRSATTDMTSAPPEHQPPTKGPHAVRSTDDHFAGSRSDTTLEGHPDHHSILKSSRKEEPDHEKSKKLEFGKSDEVFVEPVAVTEAEHEGEEEVEDEEEFEEQASLFAKLGRKDSIAVSKIRLMKPDINTEVEEEGADSKTNEGEDKKDGNFLGDSNGGEGKGGTGQTAEESPDATQVTGDTSAEVFRQEVSDTEKTPLLLDIQPEISDFNTTSDTVDFRVKTSELKGPPNGPSSKVIKEVRNRENSVTMAETQEVFYYTKEKITKKRISETKVLREVRSYIEIVVERNTSDVSLKPKMPAISEEVEPLKYKPVGGSGCVEAIPEQTAPEGPVEVKDTNKQLPCSVSTVSADTRETEGFRGASSGVLQCSQAKSLMVKQPLDNEEKSVPKHQKISYETSTSTQLEPPPAQMPCSDGAAQSSCLNKMQSNELSASKPTFEEKAPEVFQDICVTDEERHMYSTEQSDHEIHERSAELEDKTACSIGGAGSLNVAGPEITKNSSMIPELGRSVREHLCERQTNSVQCQVGKYSLERSNTGRTDDSEGADCDMHVQPFQLEESTVPCDTTVHSGTEPSTVTVATEICSWNTESTSLVLDQIPSSLLAGVDHTSTQPQMSDSYKSFSPTTTYYSFVSSQADANVAATAQSTREAKFEDSIYVSAGTILPLETGELLPLLKSSECTQAIMERIAQCEIVSRENALQERSGSFQPRCVDALEREVYQGKPHASPILRRFASNCEVAVHENVICWTANGMAVSPLALEVVTERAVMEKENGELKDVLQLYPSTPAAVQIHHAPVAVYGAPSECARREVVESCSQGFNSCVVEGVGRQVTEEPHDPLTSIHEDIPTLICKGTTHGLSVVYVNSPLTLTEQLKRDEYVSDINKGHEKATQKLKEIETNTSNEDMQLVLTVVQCTVEPGSCSETPEMSSHRKKAGHDKFVDSNNNMILVARCTSRDQGTDCQLDERSCGNPQLPPRNEICSGMKSALAEKSAACAEMCDQTAEAEQSPIDLNTLLEIRREATDIAESGTKLPLCREPQQEACLFQIPPANDIHANPKTEETSYQKNISQIGEAAFLSEHDVEAGQSLERSVVVSPSGFVELVPLPGGIAEYQPREWKGEVQVSNQHDALECVTEPCVPRPPDPSFNQLATHRGTPSYRDLEGVNADGAWPASETRNNDCVNLEAAETVREAIGAGSSGTIRDPHNSTVTEFSTRGTGMLIEEEDKTLLELSVEGRMTVRPRDVEGCVAAIPFKPANEIASSEVRLCSTHHTERPAEFLSTTDKRRVQYTVLENTRSDVLPATNKYWDVEPRSPDEAMNEVVSGVRHAHLDAINGNVTLPDVRSMVVNYNEEVNSLRVNVVADDATTAAVVAAVTSFPNATEPQTEERSDEAALTSPDEGLSVQETILDEKLKFCEVVPAVLDEMTYTRVEAPHADTCDINPNSVPFASSNDGSGILCQRSSSVTCVLEKPQQSEKQLLPAEGLVHDEGTKLPCTRQASIANNEAVNADPSSDIAVQWITTGQDGLVSSASQGMNEHTDIEAEGVAPDVVEVTMNECTGETSLGIPACVIMERSIRGVTSANVITFLASDIHRRKASLLGDRHKETREQLQGTIRDINEESLVERISSALSENANVEGHLFESMSKILLECTDISESQSYIIYEEHDGSTLPLSEAIAGETTGGLVGADAVLPARETLDLYKRGILESVNTISRQDYTDELYPGLQYWPVEEFACSRKRCGQSRDESTLGDGMLDKSSLREADEELANVPVTPVCVDAVSLDGAHMKENTECRSQKKTSTEHPPKPSLTMYVENGVATTKSKLCARVTKKPNEMKKLTDFSQAALKGSAVPPHVSDTHESASATHGAVEDVSAPGSVETKEERDTTEEKMVQGVINRGSHKFRAVRDSFDPLGGTTLRCLSDTNDDQCVVGMPSSYHPQGVTDAAQFVISKLPTVEASVAGTSEDVQDSPRLSLNLSKSFYYTSDEIPPVVDCFKQGTQNTITDRCMTEVSSGVFQGYNSVIAEMSAQTQKQA
ncbi:uncharacterized protein LOC135391851 [Ornithodoros turicata]|uniref:uncharacterized protein LOC135391851 n=1 Tax=Ornithodoros turicata TaxID=34597 RepID=UPI00313A3DC5